MKDRLRSALADAQNALRELLSDESALRTLEDAAGLVARTLGSGGKLLACGNGGSMGDAMHFCEEWTGRFRQDRRPYAAIALGDPTQLTCIANDFGFEQVFARQVRALGATGDLLIVLSTSGNSPNVVLAAREARAMGIRVVGLLGRGGGKAIGECDVALLCPGETPDRIQELHMLCLHAIIEAAEVELGHGEVRA